MQMFYLQNETAGYCGNSPLWWAKGGNGYTPRLDDAEMFTPSEATKIIRSTSGSHRWKRWPVKLIDRLAHREVDIQDVRESCAKKLMLPSVASPNTTK